MPRPKHAKLRSLVAAYLRYRASELGLPTPLDVLVADLDELIPRRVQAQRCREWIAANRPGEAHDGFPSKWHWDRDVLRMRYGPRSAARVTLDSAKARNSILFFFRRSPHSSAVAIVATRYPELHAVLAA